MCGWATYTPATGYRLRGGRWKQLACLVKELMSVSRRGGYVTIFDDEVTG